jgi:hypothetical protein
MHFIRNICAEALAWVSTSNIRIWSEQLQGTHDATTIATTLRADERRNVLDNTIVFPRCTFASDQSGAERHGSIHFRGSVSRGFYVLSRTYIILFYESFLGPTSVPGQSTTRVPMNPSKSWEEGKDSENGKNRTVESEINRRY